jgi:hypothetical protein
MGSWLLNLLVLAESFAGAQSPAAVIALLFHWLPGFLLNSVLSVQRRTRYFEPAAAMIR